MAVFKASWTSTGTVSMVESRRNTCNLHSLLGQDALTKPLGLFHRGQGQLAGAHLNIHTVSKLHETLPPLSTLRCCSCRRAAICCKRLLHCCFWAASCCLISSRSFSTWDMADIKKATWDKFPSIQVSVSPVWSMISYTSQGKQNKRIYPMLFMGRKPCPGITPGSNYCMSSHPQVIQIICSLQIKLELPW